MLPPSLSGPLLEKVVGQAVSCPPVIAIAHGDRVIPVRLECAPNSSLRCQVIYAKRFEYLASLYFWVVSRSGRNLLQQVVAFICRDRPDRSCSILSSVRHPTKHPIDRRGLWLLTLARLASCLGVLRRAPAG